jgi:carbamoyl-phosphate synthase large subunit
LQNGMSVDEIHELTKIDKWFLEKLKNITDLKLVLEKHHSVQELPTDLIRKAKKSGYSDFQIARLVFKGDDAKMEDRLLVVRKERQARGIVPVVKQIDTMAGEFPAKN